MSREAILASWLSQAETLVQQTGAKQSVGGQPAVLVEDPSSGSIPVLGTIRERMWKNVPSIPRRRDWWRLVVGLLALQVHRVVSLISQSTWLRRAALRDFPLDRPLTPSSQESYDSECERDSD